MRPSFSSERIGLSFHGNTVTHLDAPCHLFWDGAMYNGRPHTEVDAETGSSWAAVTAAADGIVTRGVLLDVARGAQAAVHRVARSATAPSSPYARRSPGPAAAINGRDQPSSRTVFRSELTADS